MKIYKIAQIAQMPQQPNNQKPPKPGQELTEALNPKMKTILNNTLMGSGLNRQKVLSFLEQLFTAFGDVPVSKITGMIKTLNTEEQQVQQVQQPTQATPDKGVAQQESQTMIPPTG